MFGAVDSIFIDQQVAGAAPSAAWGVFDRRGLLHTGAAGALDDNRAPTPDTAYRIASCTKSFTAAAVLALRDAGRLHLDEPLTRFVPAFAQVVLPTADSPTPTVRMLLTMSAGLPTDDAWADRMEASTAADLDGLLSRGISFDSVPGTDFAYSNLGFALLGRVIEVAAGQPYREVVHDLLLAPLGLRGTGFDSASVIADRIAPGTRLVDDVWRLLPFSGPGAFSPIGGLFSTLRDLSRWAAWLAAAFDESAEAPGPLSRASRRELQQLHRFVPDLSDHPGGYGFGLFVEHSALDGLIVSHSGGYPGFSAHMRWSPCTGVGIVAFENATRSRVPLPAVRAFDLLNEAVRVTREPRLWPATRSAQTAVNALLRDWSDAAAERLFAFNVALDEAYPRRRAAIADAIAAVGGLTPPGSTPLPTPTSEAPSHLIWQLSGRTGSIKVEIALNPEHPPRVQTLTVEVLAEADERSAGGGQ